MGQATGNIMEDVFTAITQITQAELKTLQFDKTIKAVIVNADEANKGIYLVSRIGAEASGAFKAYSSNTNYKLSDCVYVTIPEGDMASNNKLIIGKYVDKDETYYNYTDPMSSYLDVSGNLINIDTTSTWGLTANYADISFIPIWEKQDLDLRGYNRLAIKADFKTWLQSLDICSGSYGLLLMVEEEGSGKIFTFTLMTDDMYGNPYYYETFYSQEVLIDISEIEQIKGMYLTFIQRNDFLTSLGDLAVSLTEDKDRIPANIFMCSPYISVGYDISEFKEDDLRISTNDQKIYNSQSPSEQRTIDAKWIHVTEGKSAIIIDNIIEMPRNPNYEPNQSGNNIFPTPETKVDLHWFEYNSKLQIADTIAGLGWKKLDVLNEFAYTFITPNGESTQGEANNIPYVKYKAIIEYPSLRYINSTFVMTNEYQNATRKNTDESNEDKWKEGVAILHQIMNNKMTYSDGKKAIDKIYTGISSSDHSNFNICLSSYLTQRSEIKYIESTELTFNNTGYDPSKNITDALGDLTVVVDPDGLKGHYAIYDDNGLITDISEALKTRYCYVSYNTSAVINNEYTGIGDTGLELSDADLVTWYIPLDNTMIATPEEGIEYNNAKEVIKEYIITATENDDGVQPGRYCKICRIPQLDEKEVNPSMQLVKYKMLTEQPFRIKDYYTQMETNNTIYCRVTRKSHHYYGAGALTFDISGTNGTNSTFGLKMCEVNADGSISSTQSSALSLKTLYCDINESGQIMRLQDKTGKIAIVPYILDYNNKVIENYFQTHEIQYRFYGFKEDDDESLLFSKTAVDKSDGHIIISWKNVLDDLNDNSKNYYLVIEAEVPYNITYDFLRYTEGTGESTDLTQAQKDLGLKAGDFILDANGQKQPIEENGKPKTRADFLKTYLPIALIKQKILQKTIIPKTNEKALDPQPSLLDYQTWVVGANKVLYDRNGSNAKYYKDSYQLYDSLQKALPEMKWSPLIYNVEHETDINKKAAIASFYPTVSPSNILVPLETYILSDNDNLSKSFCVKGQLGEETLCIQPVLIMQNKYGSPMMNQWDGSLTINEKNGIILSSMVGAGKKDQNNTFSGVLMGEVAQAYPDNHNGLGLYGFNQSQQSFGFNIDGSAFIGKAGHGRIWFDGNNGTITSGTYSDGVDKKYKDADAELIRPQQGMQIDLDGKDGISSSIHAFGPNGGFVVDLGQQTTSGWIDTPVTFKLFTGKYKTSERGMIYFDMSGQYIQSINYDGFYDTAKTIAPTGLNTQTQPPGWVEVGGDFPAHNPASTGMFIDLGNGWIDARKGIIGGWQLGKNSLMTPKQEIVLWAGDSNSADSTSRTGKIPNIQIGALDEEGKMQGKLWISDYLITAETADGTSVDTISLSGSESISLNNSLTDNNDTSVSGTIDAISYTTNTTSKLELNTNGINYWGLKDDSQKYINLNLGINLKTASSSDSNIVIFEPAGANVALLGTRNTPWTSAHIEKGLFVWEKFNAFNEDTALCNGAEVKGWHCVASQPWITNVIVPMLQKRMKQINSYYWSKVKMLTEGIVALSGVTKVSSTGGEGATTVTIQSYSITAPNGKITVSPGGSVSFTVASWEAMVDLRLDVNDLQTRVAALETFMNNHSHSGFLTGLPTHSHSGTDSAGKTITVT